jgi:hypothetical protein
MEKRQYKRKNVHLNAEIISAAKVSPCLIENISGLGMNVETDAADPLSTKSRFTPGDKYKVRFNTPSGDLITLQCRVIWSYKTAPHGLKKKIGLEILDPPADYINFFKEIN